MTLKQLPISQYGILFSILFFITFGIYSGTLTDAFLYTHNSYLADKDGFDSLFINPAGMAGQTSAFNLYMTGGAWSDDIEYLKNLEKMLVTLGNIFSPSEEASAKEVSDAMELMANEISQNSLDALLDGTSVAGMTLSDAANPQTWTDWSTTADATDDIKKIKKNATNPVLQEKIKNEFDITYDFEAGFRLGTLIHGVGFGTYINVYSKLSLVALGFNDMIAEVGSLVGYGFDIGQFSFGIRGQYAMIVTEGNGEAFSFFSKDIAMQSLMLGDAWGMDIGTIWEPATGLRFALVVNDIIGSRVTKEKLVPVTLAELMYLNFPSIDNSYVFGVDAGIGMSWEETIGDFLPKISVDFYEVIGFFRSLNGDNSGLEDLYRADVSNLSRHLRVGFNINIVKVLDIGISHFMDRIKFEFGFDFKKFRISLGLNTKSYFSDFGGGIMMELNI